MKEELYRVVDKLSGEDKKELLFYLSDQTGIFVEEVKDDTTCIQCSDVIPPLNVYPNKLCDKCYMVDDLGNSVTTTLEVQND